MQMSLKYYESDTTIATAKWRTMIKIPLLMMILALPGQLIVME
jgi:hypothetical protein